ncbi:MAG: Arc family DNA-binding protein [Lachnospiraceae bacterium]|nr:Arc family DNA-binding protein [Lachnospiraceae bacterium]
MFELKKESSDYENKSLRLPKELIEKVQSLANEYNMSFNKVVIQCIEYSLDNMKKSE